MKTTKGEARPAMELRLRPRSTDTRLFRKRVADALRQRLFPHAPLHVAQFAGSIRRSDDTVARWLHEDTRIYGEDVAVVASYFAAKGDGAFLNEIYGDSLGPLPKPANGQQVGASSDICIWFTDDGAMHVAKGGHSHFAREVAGLSAQAGGDIVAGVMRNLGWVAGLLQTDGMVELRYVEHAISALAAARTRDWLEKQLAGGMQVRRRVEVGNGRWLDAMHPSPRSAAAAISDAPGIAAKHKQSAWQTERLALDAITDQGMGELLGSYRLVGHEPGRMIEIAAKLGLLDRSSILRVESESDVRSLFVGPALGINAAAYLGRNVLERTDLRYGDLVRHHVIGARTEPTFHHLRISIDGEPVEYQRIALPVAYGDNMQLVMTCSHVVARGEAAA